MRYLGGKSRLSDDIAGFINSTIGKDQSYWEPFVGSGWIVMNVRAKRKFASDINFYLIEMWKALQRGWVPPFTLSEEEYVAIKDSRGDYDPALVAFAGFACSWGGKWFGGYARTGRQNYAENGARSVTRKVLDMMDVQFFTADFFEQEPPENNMYIYCDPPYAGTTGYDIAEWDTLAFWNRVEELESCGHTVLVSEYDAPERYTCVREMYVSTRVRPRNGNEIRTEKLYMLNPIEPAAKQLSIFDFVEVKNAKEKQQG